MCIRDRLIGCGVFLGALVFSERQPGQRGLQVVGILALLWGVMCVVGAGLGGTDPLKPLGSLGSDTSRDGESAQDLEWRGVKSLADVQQAVRDSQKPVLLDVYADWCISCKVMEEQVLTLVTQAMWKFFKQTIQRLKISIHTGNIKYPYLLLMQVLDAFHELAKPILCFGLRYWLLKFVIQVARLRIRHDNVEVAIVGDD